jgi:hypothetical protein
MIAIGKCPECNRKHKIDLQPGFNFVICRNKRHYSKPEIQFLFLPGTTTDANYTETKYNSPQMRTLGRME